MSKRLDQELVDRKLILTRSQARLLIKQGDVKVDGVIVSKPSQQVGASANIEIMADELYVSRGAFKLLAAIETFSLEFRGKKIADCGASTGGFTEILLKQGAEKVYCVDVGHDQLHHSLKTHPKVDNREGVNLKHPYSLPEPVDFCVADLSFISLKLVFDTMASFLKEAGSMVLLIKPQFEAGKQRIGKNGIVDLIHHDEIIDDFVSFAADKKFHKQGLCRSPITGKKGNTEYLIWLTRDLFRSEV